MLAVMTRQRTPQPKAVILVCIVAPVPPVTWALLAVRAAVVQGIMMIQYRFCTSLDAACGAQDASLYILAPYRSPSTIVGLTLPKRSLRTYYRRLGKKSR